MRFGTAMTVVALALVAGAAQPAGAATGTNEVRCLTSSPPPGQYVETCRLQVGPVSYVCTQERHQEGSGVHGITTTDTDCRGGAGAGKVSITSVCSDHSLQGYMYSEHTDGCVTTIRIGARTITCTHDPPIWLGSVHDPLAIGPDPDPDQVPSCA